MRPTSVARLPLYVAIAALGTTWLATPGFTAPQAPGSTSVVGPRERTARQAMVAFAYAAAVADGEAVAAVLHDSLTTSWGATKSDLVAQVTGSRKWQMRFELRYAVFTEESSRTLASPVIQYGPTHRYAHAFELVRDGQNWLIVRIDMGVEMPLELQESDRRNPEHHLLHPVTVRLRDQKTSAPVFARINVTDASGEYWPPEGHMKKVDTAWNPEVSGDAMIGGKSFAYVGPDFSLPLPIGSYEMEVVRGMEYEPRTIHFVVTASHVPTLEVELERWSNLEQEGWFSGDTHAHFIDPSSGLLEMKGEDLNVLNVLVTKWAELITNVEHFTGAPSELSEARHIIYVNEESRHGFLGHVNFLNLREPVYPLSWGGQAGGGVLGGPDYPTMASLADKAHAQGGLVVWAHFPFPGGELAVDMALGKIDAIELMSMGDAFSDIFGQLGPADTWYRFLNLGFRVPAVAGTDKMQNTVVVGSVRTYVKMEGPLTYEDWIEGIRAGRTFTTTGPMLQFSANGAEVGETITSETGGMISINVEVNSRTPIDRIEIVRGGEVVATKENPTGARRVGFTTEIPIDGSTWIAARAVSAVRLPYNQDLPLFAHTSPIYVDVPSRPISSPEDAAYFAEQCALAIEWAKSTAKVLDESQREEMIELYEKARQIYLDMAGASGADR